MSLLLGFGFLFVCYFFAGLAAPVLAAWLYGGGNDYTTMLATPGGQNAFRTVQIVTALLIWGLAAVFWAVYTGTFKGRLGFRNRTWWGFYPLAGLVILVAFPLVQELIISSENFALPESMKGLEEWARSTEGDAKGKYELLLGNFSTGAVLGNFLAIAVVPAVVEELFFRGFLLSSLRRLFNPHVAVWGSALVFSLLHFQFFGFASRFFLGAVLGYFFLYSGNLWTSILGHFLHNAVTLTIYLLALRGTVDAAILEDDFGFGWALTLCSACITFLLLYLYSRNAHLRNTHLIYE